MFLPSSIQAVLIFYIPLFYLVIGTATNNLLLTLPPTIPRLPSSTRAVLTTTGAVLTAPITYANTFLFQNLSSTPTSYILDISCRDYDFVSMRVEVLAGGVVEVWRGRRDAATGGLEKLVEQGATGGWEVKVKAKRDYFEDRGGFSPLSLLKNPMILIGVVGLAFVFGMPYLLDSMDPEMRKEFEEQRQKGILNTAASGGANPLQNFDMAAWMAGKTVATSSSNVREEQGGERSASKGIRRRG